MTRVWLVLGALLLLFAGSGAAPGPVEAQQGAGGRTDVLISFGSATDADDVRDVRAFGAQGLEAFSIAPVIAANVPQWAVPFLERLPGVVAVEPDFEAHATTIASELNNTWGVQDIDAGLVHASGNTGAGVVVAVIDTGVYCNHPDLVGSCSGGWDFVNNDADPSDDNGHGTHVSGTLSANRNGANVVGVAPDSTLLPVKVLNASGSGSYSNIIAGLQYAVAQGADVINMSLGGSGYSSALESAVNAAYNAGVVVVASAGNSGGSWWWGTNVLYPARFASVIAVGAVDQNHNLASFSSTGSEVELAAPGVAVRSTTKDGGYADWNGTSMAAPHVSGTAALMIAGGMTGSTQVRQRLQQTAEDLGAPGRDNQTGFGLVNAAAAVPGGGGPPPPPPGNDPPTVTITGPVDGSSYVQGTNIAFSATVTDTEDNNATLTSALAWTSSLDGSLGTGGSLSRTLSVGTHTVTAAVTDSGGANGSDSIQITVTAAAPPPPPSSGTLVVESVSYGSSWSGLILTVNVTIVDGNGNGVSAASVSADISNGSRTYSRSGTTNAAGTVTWSIFLPASGCYTTTITNVASGTQVWNGVTPPNNSC